MPARLLFGQAGQACFCHCSCKERDDRNLRTPCQNRHATKLLGSLTYQKLAAHNKVAFGYKLGKAATDMAAAIAVHHTIAAGGQQLRSPYCVTAASPWQPLHELAPSCKRTLCSRTAINPQCRHASTNVNAGPTIGCRRTASGEQRSMLLGHFRGAPPKA